MKSYTKLHLVISSLVLILVACESDEERKQRVAIEKQEKIELEEKQNLEEAERAFRQEQERIEEEKRAEEERIARETRLEIERKQKATYDRYITNSLNTGSTPYAYCFGKNSSCTEYGCSKINVKTPYNSDVLVTLKKGDIVVRHAYIRAGSSYSFELQNGIYQPFFYYGKGWNPNKFMKQTSCGPLEGGFIENENFGKDSPQSLSNNILQYELILQQNGNFSTRPSNPDEAF